MRTTKGRPGHRLPRPLWRGWPLVALVLAGCSSSEPRREPPSRLAVDVLADTGRSERLRIQPPSDPGPDSAPPARVWLAKVTPARPASIEPPLPEPEIAAPDVPLPSPPGLEIQRGLQAPILRRRGRLMVPSGVARGWVDLDVRVAEDGAVSEAFWADGSQDSALVAAAVRCALEMSFYPALQDGRPVVVWCRQRFEFGRR